MKDVIDQYLRRHARPEAGAAAEVTDGFRCAVVVPVRNENPGALDRLLASADDSVLWIFVVNASADGLRPGDVACLEALLQGGRQKPLADGITWVAGGSSRVVVDRALPGRAFTERDGVGLARRIGFDLALMLFSQGRLLSPYLRTTDADASPSDDFFEDLRDLDVVASVHPFWHCPGGDPEVDRATAIYEIALRYHVVGLARAGSPWAHHSLGSVLSVRADAYAKVRGVPLRRGGEDFHLLAKLGKIGPIVRSAGAPVTIASRQSDRVPFGTGPAVGKILAASQRGQDFEVYHPAVYERLREVLQALEGITEDARHDPVAAIDRLAASDAPTAAGLATIGGVSGLHEALRGASTPSTRWRRSHEWFDALSTLRFIHGARDGGLASVPWPRAVTALLGAADDEIASMDVLRRRLATLEPVRAGLHRSKR